MSPLPANDVRRRNKSTSTATKPTSGNIKGVGWSVKSVSNSIINMDANPTGDMTLDEANSAGITIEQMSKRWPAYARGTSEHSSVYADILRQLWRARKIPGLSPEAHSLYTGEPLAREVYDAAHSEDRELLAAWQSISGTQTQFNPGDVALEKRIEQLEVRVKDLERFVGK